MGLTMAERKGSDARTGAGVPPRSRREKGNILDRLVKLNGWTRHHAAWVLRCWGSPCTTGRAGA